MLRLLQFVQNFTAIFIVFLLVAISTVATMTLSPVALDDSSGSVAGAETSQGQVLSNFKPLSFEDLNITSNDYDTQLIESSPLLLSYSFNLAPTDTGIFTKPFISVTNLNMVDLEVVFKGKLPENVSEFVNLLVSDNTDRRLISDAMELVLRVPANSTVNLDLVFDIKETTNFPIVGSVEITTSPTVD